ncbi:MAG: type II toxin-antitoxin system HipA family toxin [Ferrimicrobium sp.]
MPASVEVTGMLGAQEVVVGTLWFHERTHWSATFQYAPEYVRNPSAYAIDPSLELVLGAQHTRPGQDLFNVFKDSSPDRWGQMLLVRSLSSQAPARPWRPSPEFYLLGVRDDLRHGALRYRIPGEDTYYGSVTSPVPPFVAIERLLRLADNLHDGVDQDLAMLIEAGSSLGGARPKATVALESGELAVVKFPKRTGEDWDVNAWEKVVSELASRSGIPVPQTQLLTFGARHVFISKRFDREGSTRRGFASALTMLESHDMEVRSYPEIAEVIMRHGTFPQRDLEDLYRRMVFNLLVGDSDDHLRNHGFLRSDTGWELSPAYDMNPNPNYRGVLTTSVAVDSRQCDIGATIEVAPYFRITEANARAIITATHAATQEWRTVARSYAIPGEELNRMEQAFESEYRLEARSLGNGEPVRPYGRG